MYTNLFIFRFVSLLCLRSTLHLLYYFYSLNIRFFCLNKGVISKCWRHFRKICVGSYFRFVHKMFQVAKLWLRFANCGAELPPNHPSNWHTVNLKKETGMSCYVLCSQENPTSLYDACGKYNFKFTRDI